MTKNVFTNNRRLTSAILFLTLLLIPCLVHAQFQSREVMERRQRIDREDFVSKNDFIVNKDLPNLTGKKLYHILVHGIVNTQIQEDTNIFLNQDNKKTDTILLINPAVGIIIPLKDFSLSFGYDTSIYRNNTYTSQDRTDKYLAAMAEWKLTNHTISFRNLYSDYSSRASSEDTNRNRRIDNETGLDIKTLFEKLKMVIGYRHKNEDFRSSDFIYEDVTSDDKDNKRDAVNLRISYDFRPKTAVLFEMQHGTINYDSPKSASSRYTETLIGLSGQPRYNLKINFKLGYRQQNYDHSTVSLSEDFGDIISRGRITYTFDDNDIFELYLLSSPFESTYQNINYYRSRLAELKYTKLLTHKIAANLFVSIQENTYPSETTENEITQKRKDEFIRFGGRLRYYIRDWLSTEAEYEYTNRDSNFTSSDYNVSLTSLRVTMGF